MLPLFVVLSLQLLLPREFFLQFFSSADSIDRFLGDQSISLFCQGKISDSVEKKEERTYLFVRLEKCREQIGEAWKPMSGKIRLTILNADQQFFKGDWIRFKGRLRRPSGLQNPGGFNARLYFESKGIGATGFIRNPQWVAILPIEKEENFFSSAVQTVRWRLQTLIPNSHGGDAKNLLLALLIADRRPLSERVQETFRNTGTAHLLALSGLHVGLLVGVIGIFCWPLVFFSRLSHRGFFEIGALVSLPLVWCYIAVADFPISAMRAGIMATFVLL